MWMVENLKGTNRILDAAMDVIILEQHLATA